MKTRLHIFSILTVLVISIIGCNKDDETIDVDNNNSDIGSDNFDDVAPDEEIYIELIFPQTNSKISSSRGTTFKYKDSYNSPDKWVGIYYKVFIHEDRERIDALDAEANMRSYYYNPYRFLLEEGYTLAFYDDDGYYNFSQYFSDYDMINNLKSNTKYYWRVRSSDFSDNPVTYYSTVGEFATD